MKAMILAAGRGERMRPLTDETPKPLLKIDQYCLIEHHIFKLKQAGITDIVINTAWLAEKIQTFLGDGSNYGVQIQYSNEEQALETGGGIKQALQYLGDDKFLVINGDVWSDVDLKEFIQHHKTNTQAHLLLVDNPEHNSDGDFSINNGLLSNACDKRLTYSGIGIYSAGFFTGITEKVFPLGPLLRQAAEKQLISAEKHEGFWLDVGTPARLQQLKARLS